MSEIKAAESDVKDVIVMCPDRLSLVSPPPPPGCDDGPKLPTKA